MLEHHQQWQRRLWMILTSFESILYARVTISIDSVRLGSTIIYWDQRNARWEFQWNMEHFHRSWSVDGDKP